MKLKNITRDKNGLITKGDVEYVFTEDGLIDWRKMIKSEYLVPNRQRTKETDVSKLSDNQLIILLGGIKELAQIRGYTNVGYTVTSPSPDYVVATCSIDWIPSYETEGQAVTFSAIGDASPQNTKDFARYFLGPIAENRAFVRCVRNFLRINIVSQEELGNAQLDTSSEAEDSDNATDPRHVLEKLMKSKGITFEIIKSKLVKEDYDKAENFNSILDIPKIKTFELIERLQKYKAK